MEEIQNNPNRDVRLRKGGEARPDESRNSDFRTSGLKI